MPEQDEELEVIRPSFRVRRLEGGPLLCSWMQSDGEALLPTKWQGCVLWLAACLPLCPRQLFWPGQGRRVCRPARCSTPAPP